MTAPQYDLGTIQRWMQSVITYPGGVAAGVETPAAREQIDITAAQIEQVVTRSEKLDAVNRMEVYSGAYFARLLECMRGEFPVLMATIGEELFDQFVVGYLNAYPSRSYSLGHLGENFAKYLAETSPREEGRITPWAEFLDRIGSFGMGLQRGLRRTGRGTGSKIIARTITQMSPPRNGRMPNLAVVPCLRLMRFSHPVSRFFTAKRRRRRDTDPRSAGMLSRRESPRIHRAAV